jgi:hypothetical protein
LHVERKREKEKRRKREISLYRLLTAMVGQSILLERKREISPKNRINEIQKRKREKEKNLLFSFSLVKCFRKIKSSPKYIYYRLTNLFVIKCF